MFEEWAKELGVDTSSPGYLRAKQLTRERMARSVDYVCVFGCCVWQYDPVDEVIRTGVGRPGCPCDDSDNKSLKLGTLRAEQ